MPKGVPRPYQTNASDQISNSGTDAPESCKQKKKNYFFEQKKNLIKFLPIEAMIGPTALAKAPSDRKIPRTVPF